MPARWFSLDPRNGDAEVPYAPEIELQLEARYQRWLVDKKADPVTVMLGKTEAKVHVDTMIQTTSAGGRRKVKRVEAAGGPAPPAQAAAKAPSTMTAATVAAPAPRTGNKHQRQWNR